MVSIFTVVSGIGKMHLVRDVRRLTAVRAYPVSVLQFVETIVTGLHVADSSLNAENNFSIKYQF